MPFPSIYTRLIIRFYVGTWRKNAIRGPVAIDVLSTVSGVSLDKGFIAWPDSVDEYLQQSRGFVRGVCSSIFHNVFACGFAAMLLYFSETAQPLATHREGGKPRNCLKLLLDTFY